MKKYSMNHHFIASNMEEDGRFHIEQSYTEFSKRMIHDYYGSAMHIEVDENNRSK